VTAAVPQPPAPTYAGHATRTHAFAVHALVIKPVAVLVGAVVALGLSLLTLSETAKTVIAAVAACAALLWAVAYFVFFWSGTGQTPGDRLLGIAVRDGSATRSLSARRALLRVIVLPLSALLLCAGFLMILFDRRRRALHDRIARSCVVYVPVSSRRLRAPAEPERRAPAAV
jgi:uncharacterized RDD family membrane protein YckC